MSKAVSKSFVLRRQGPGTKEVSKVHQGCLASRETEAVETDLGMSTALSKGLLADRHRPSPGEARFSKVPCREHRATDVVRRVCSK
jgi:hypothetical protein